MLLPNNKNTRKPIMSNTKISTATENNLTELTELDLAGIHGGGSITVEPPTRNQVILDLQKRLERLAGRGGGGRWD
jgi:hypothetical protein